MTDAYGLPDFPVLSLVHVGTDGSMGLVAANLPYEELSWTRRLSTCGEFSAQLACDFPAAWPGRYLVSADGMDEVGVVEKVEATEDGSGDSCTVSGRFAESLWDRYALSREGEECAGANWRQAVTLACTTWLMGDAPPVALGDGTAGTVTGGSYRITGDPGKAAMGPIYTVTEDNGARPLLSYDRDADPGHLVLSIVEGLDRTRSQSENPLCVISLSMGNAASVEYSGDYSTMCSEVVAYATAGEDEGDAVSATVAVPGFDAGTMWEQRAYEDVSSLAGDDPGEDAVRSAGALRSYDHMASLAVDCELTGGDYRLGWDLGDLVEVEVPSLSLVASERVEEVVETWGAGGRSVTATVGTKQISKVARALIGRR